MPPSHLRPSPTILLPDLPPKTLVGIDLITFTSAANFHGIRDLPRGWHFLYTGTTESLSLRSGAWFYVGDVGAEEEDRQPSEMATALVSTATTACSQTLTSPEIHVWKWSSDTETLVSLKPSSDTDKQEAMRCKANLGAVWQRGGLFRYRSRVSPAMLSSQSNTAQTGDVNDNVDDKEEENEENGRRDWHALTDRISPALLALIIGNPEVDVDGHPRWTVTSASTANRDADHIPGLDEPVEGAESATVQTAGEQERELAFLPIDLKRTWREGAVGRERTEAAQDRSWALGDLIQRYSAAAVGSTSTTEYNDGSQRVGEAQILGELQFTFLMVLTMMNYSCLQQWKRLLELILTSRRALLDRETFMRDVLRLLLLQLKRCDDAEGGLFEIDGDEGGAFLRKLLMKLRRSVDEVLTSSDQSLVKTELDKLEAWVKNEYDWEIQPYAILRRGMVQLEDGEEVELEMDGNDQDEETGEYAPLVVDLGDGGAVSDEGDVRDAEMWG